LEYLLEISIGLSDEGILLERKVLALGSDILGSREGALPIHQLKEQDAKRPDINHHGVPIGCLYFGGHVGGGAEDRVQVSCGVLALKLGQPEVADLVVPVNPLQHVLQLEVPVDQVAAVQVGQPPDDVRKDFQLVLKGMFMLGQQRLDRPLAVLHHQEHLFFLLEMFPEGHYVLVVQALVDSDLRLGILFVNWVLTVQLVYYFYGHHLVLV
jgi:hypothetical protein